MAENDGVARLLEHAAMFRQAGFEGKARVTCRLAAANSLRILFEKCGEQLPPGSSVDLIRVASEKQFIPVEIKQLIGHFSQKVDENFQLTGDIDLLEDAIKLDQWVMNKTNGAEIP